MCIVVCTSEAFIVALSRGVPEKIYCIKRHGKWWRDPGVGQVAVTNGNGGGG